MTDENMKATDPTQGPWMNGLEQANAQALPTPTPDSQVDPSRGSAVARFNEEPFIVAVKALLAKIDIEPKIGWEVEWQAVRRELKALEESMQ